MSNNHDTVKNTLDIVSVFATIGSFLEMLTPVFGLTLCNDPIRFRACPLVTPSLWPVLWLTPSKSRLPLF